MAQITPNLQLTVWNNLDDLYDSGQLVDNFVKIDLHNHDGNGGGVQLNGSTAIVPDSISSKQIGANAVGSTELLSDASLDSLRAVTANHIQSSAVTTDKIADNSITVSKLAPGAVTVPPVVVHAGANGSLPTETSTGDPLYDGYVIDYTNSATVASRTYFWRLRYNGTSWDYVGGWGYKNTESATLTATSNGPASGNFYTRWDNTNFQTFTLPLKGKYFVIAGGSGDPQEDHFATFHTGLYLGGNGSGNNPAYTQSPISGSRASTLTFGVTSTLTNEGDQASSSVVNSIIDCTTNASSGNVLRQLFGCGTKFRLAVSSNLVTSSGAPDASGANFNLRFQHLYVIPYKGLTNFS